ncbi:MAG TPA: L-histidine N(alpha)-methyltransferase [Burkholderiaceae bacterium]
MLNFPHAGSSAHAALTVIPGTDAVPDVALTPAQAELAAGLRGPFASISPKYLYDELGSKLFEAICELPEYYPTRVEAGIHTRYKAQIADACGRGVTLIDLGAGNCAKAASLFSALGPAQYIPVDISAEYLHAAVAGLQQRHPAIPMLPLALDFSTTLELPVSVRTRRRLFFYPGSSIGNFTPIEAGAMLRRMRAACGSEGGVLLGVDLIKDKKVLDAAYDDALGVTAAFNLNVLRHANRLLGADFDLRQWRHLGFFNRELGRVEMHLEARQAVTVHWHGEARRFIQGERIHTENSYKYTPEAFLKMLSAAGFADAQVWTDPDGHFAVIHARAQ